MKDIFLCYGREDQAVVENLYDELKGHGFSPWMDVRDLLPGDVWKKAAQKAMRNSKVLIACLSKKSVTRRGEVNKELDEALEIHRSLPSGEVFLVPLRLDDCEYPEKLGHIHYEDYFTEAGRTKLIKAVAKQLGVSTVAYPRPRESVGLADLRQRKPLAIGVDVGTTKIAIGLIGLSNPAEPDFLLTQRIKHAEISEQGILDKIEGVIRELVSYAQLEMTDIERIGIGLPGQVDYKTGVLLFAPGLKLRNINVSRTLGRRLKVPVHSDNDVNCSTFAELKFGYGRLFKTFVCVFVGTGIGSGVVIDGKLYRGSTFAAGEVGHMKVDCTENARLCTCGAKGCLEEYASARAIVRMAREKIHDVKERGLNSLLRDLDPATVAPEDIVRLAHQKDEASVELAKRIAFTLAVAIANIANLLNPKAVILGGGIIEGFYGLDFFDMAVAEGFTRNTLGVCANTRILLSKLGDDAPILGASALVAMD